MNKFLFGTATVIAWYLGFISVFEVSPYILVLLVFSILGVITINKQFDTAMDKKDPYGMVARDGAPYYGGIFLTNTIVVVYWLVVIYVSMTLL